MAASTRLRVFKTGTTLRTLTMPDQDVSWDDKADLTYVNNELATKKDTFTENTAFNKDFETTETEIKENGTQAVGTSLNLPRADHVHPSDTTKADKEYTINNQIGTTYTLALVDSGALVAMNNDSSNTLTIPTNASVAFS